MWDFLTHLFDSSAFVPRSVCGDWSRGHIWLHNLSDAAIWLAYLAIPVVLVYFVRRRNDMPFKGMFLLFGAFIVSCGFTHFMEVVMFYSPLYRLAGLLKLFTALVSWGTIVALVRVVPRALTLRSPAELEREVRARTQAETALQAANAELDRRVQDVTARTRELVAANEELEAFSYSVSHDLRAPLRAIDGFSRILLAEYAANLPDEARGYLDDVRSNTAQMGRLVDDLLAFSHLGRQPIRKQAVPLAAMVRECLDELRAEQHGRNVEFRVGELSDCRADPMLLKQVWMNLLSNAQKYTGKCQAAVIEIGCTNGDRPGERHYFVKDNGVGFDMRYAHKLFGVFQRLHRADEYPGTGVGLAIVQRIVQRHGGRVWADAQPEQGAAFYFTLENEGASHE
ncbi:MAG TPA: ATP-binding protein [Pirellulales bacterium]|nr:ATP-binding protein [Pirellulales bacterium]